MIRLAPNGDDVKQVAPAGYGMSSSISSALKMGERIILPDDNMTTSPITPVWAYDVPGPRIHGFQILQGNFIAGTNSPWGTSQGGAGAGVGYDTPDASHFAVGALSTGTTTTGRAVVATAGGAQEFIFNASSHQRVFEMVFKIPTLSDATNTFVTRFGWLDSVVGAATDGAYFELDSNANANLLLVTAAGGTRTSSDTGYTIAAGTWYLARILVPNRTSVDAYVTTELAAIPSTPTKSNTTNIPNGITQSFYFGIQLIKSAGTTARTLSYRYAMIGEDRLAA